MKELILILLIIIVLYKFKENFIKENLVLQEGESKELIENVTQEEESKELIENVTQEENLVLQEEESKELIKNLAEESDVIDKKILNEQGSKIKKESKLNEKSKIKKLEFEYKKLSDYISYTVEGKKKIVQVQEEESIPKDIKLMEEEELKIMEESHPNIQDEEDYYVEGGYDSIFMNLNIPPNYFSFSERNIFLERSLSINLYNYLLNFNINSPINNRGNQSKNLRTYIINLKYVKNIFDVEFITDANQFVNAIIKKLNEYLKEKYGNEINLTKETLISEYKIQVLDCYRNNFISNINNEIIKDNKYLSSFFFMNELFYLISDDITFFNENKRVIFNVAAIEFLVNLNVIQNVTILDYDNFDIILNAIDNFLRSHVFNIFNKKYDNIIYFNLEEVRNIFYSGKKDNFDFSFV